MHFEGYLKKMTTEVKIVNSELSVIFENRSISPSEKSKLIEYLSITRPQTRSIPLQKHKSSLISHLGRIIDRPDFTTVATVSKVYNQEQKGICNTYTKDPLKLKTEQDIAYMTLPGYGDRFVDSVITVRRIKPIK